MTNGSHQTSEQMRKDDSVRSLSESEAVAPQDSGSHLNSVLQEGKELLQAGRLKDALERFEQQLQQEPDRAKIWELKAEAHHGLGNFEEEFEALERAVALDANEIALFNRARCHLALGRSNEAQKDLREVLRIGQHEPTLGRARTLLEGLSPPRSNPRLIALDAISGAWKAVSDRAAGRLGGQVRKALSALVLTAILWAGFNFVSTKGKRHSVTIGGYSVDLLQEQVVNSDDWTPQPNDFYQSTRERVLIKFDEDGKMQTLVGPDLAVNGQKVFDDSMSGEEILKVLGEPSNVHKIVHFYVFEANGRRYVLELIHFNGKDQPPVLSLSPVGGGWEDTKSINLESWLKNAP